MARGGRAWYVFEALALAAMVVDGELVARSSVRAVAVQLRLGKDRAASAFGVLRRAGWIELRQDREPSNARFGATCYVVRAIAMDGDGAVAVDGGRGRVGVVVAVGGAQARGACECASG